MKRACVPALAVLLLFPLTTAAQETLISGRVESGGFGGPSLKYTRMLDGDGLLMGGLGGWVIGKTITLGAGGWGLVTEHEIETATETYELQFGYGGLMIEYLHDPDRLTHWYVSAIIGIGGVNFRQAGAAVDENLHDDTIWLFEPAIHGCLNFTRHLRAAVGIGYRTIIGLDDVSETTYGLTTSQLDGYSVSLTLRFGRY
jgi:hypothetical protein